jgi:uncharacterized protein YndB with AHSA1/START domain
MYAEWNLRWNDAMGKRETYAPGPAAGASIRKDADTWTLVLVRDLKHPPAAVWEAITDPAQLSEWAPFDADRNLASAGPVQLTTVGAPTPMVAQTHVLRAEEPRLLEFNWGGNALRFELEPQGAGTRLTLWHAIERGFIAWGAAGWHVCFDVLEHLLTGAPLGRIVGAEALKFEGWQRLTAEYARQFGVDAPAWRGS